MSEPLLAILLITITLIVTLGGIFLIWGREDP
jgi:hypothetical protein